MFFENLIQQKRNKYFISNMTRIKRGFVARKRRKKIISLAKGFVGSHSRIFIAANQQVMKSGRYSYFDRRKKKGYFRSLWINRMCVRYKLRIQQIM